MSNIYKPIFSDKSEKQLSKLYQKMLEDENKEDSLTSKEVRKNCSKQVKASEKICEHMERFMKQNGS